MVRRSNVASNQGGRDGSANRDLRFLGLRAGMARLTDMAQELASRLQAFDNSLAETEID
jgi:hypothetical protein